MVYDETKIRFEKVSLGEWVREIEELISSTNPEEAAQVNEIRKNLISKYDSIKLPTRATKKSAGYDFYSPFNLALYPEDIWTTVPTGIKVFIANDLDLFLMVAPKSGLGFRYRMRLANTVGIIDGDYYGNPSNEGHVLLCVANGLNYEGCPMKMVTDIQTASPRPVIDFDHPATRERILNIAEGQAFAQGVFIPYATFDKVEAERTGGIGSTSQSLLK